MKSINIIVVGAMVLSAMLLGGSFAFSNTQKTTAQMSGGNMTGGGGGMIGMMVGPGPNITGSLKFSTILGNALSSQIKVGLNQSAMTAEKTIGNSSHAVEAHFGMANGYLVYTVWVIDGSYNFHKVIVDAGNGKVLSNQPVSKTGSMMMHGMMMGGDGGGMMMQHGPSMMMRGSSSHNMMGTWNK